MASPAPSRPSPSPASIGPSKSPPRGALPNAAVWRADTGDVTAKLEDAANLLFERNKRAKLNLSTETKDAEIAELMRDAREGISKLEGMLSLAEERGTSTPRDLKMWEDSLINLTKQFERIENVALSSNAIDSNASARAELLAAPAKKRETLTVLPDDEPDEGRPSDPYADKSDPELLQLQKDIMEDQDQSLDALVSVIERQKQIGVQINQELDYHIELLEDTEERVDATTGRLGSAQKRLDVVRKTVSSNWGLCTTVGLVGLLMVVLVIIKILR
ncbi:hypothetical protein DFJ74DRAFT_654837 [Hyaloraphidium curvatum]|nr:hypothetical protein DFJ74DRAFT_654837 [Hyaloraphidium curvatum]